MYEALAQLDGSHPWRNVCPDGFVDYRAQVRPGGDVYYFNFDLAREMGIIPANHAERLTPALERSVREAFSLRIINEYDLAHPSRPPANPLKPGLYMATRYLQAQHKDKRGLHSGDGRAIWLGTLTSCGVTYDISARGTGATCLSPGYQLAGEPIKTGDDSYGYCCGTAGLDEMLGTVLMSEIFHRNGFPTERTLAVIGFEDGTAIGVRAAPNLLRPAHIFRYLKQGRFEETRSALNYFIERQVSNGHWTLPRDPRERDRRVLTLLARSYGRLAGICEEEYIFNWLSWDGDNLLASGAILDYGSIRQFASKHDKYRYDDVDRFSATLTEQRFWARYNVRVFAQAVDFVRTGAKTPLRDFQDHPCLVQFDGWFEREREFRTLWRVGFTPEQIERLRRQGRGEIADLRRALTFFEQRKIARGMEKLADGVTHKPVFLIRNLLRELPAYYQDECAARPGALMEAGRFYHTMAASYASRRDLRATPTRLARAVNFQKCYHRLIAAAGLYPRVLAEIRQRSSAINYEHRITGNGVIEAVASLLEMKDRLRPAEIQLALDRLITSQVLIPGQSRPIEARELRGNAPPARILSAMQQQLVESKETV